MEVFFAVLLAKLIGIPGLGGLLSGLFIRSLPLALVGGAASGIVGTIVLASIRITGVGVESWIMAVIAGVIAALLGWVVRGRRLDR